MKAKLIILSGLLLAGCQTPTSPTFSTVPRLPWPEAEYARLEKAGRNEVSGQAFLKTRGGDVKTCAGEKVTLSPVTTHSTQFFDIVVMGRHERFQELGGTADPRIFEYLKQTTADASGRFRLYDVPPGEYYLYTVVTWEAPTGTGLQRQGGWVGMRVTVKDGERNEFVLTR